MDLHVTSLRGGGACPSQYWGQTHDGREVYIRYRGGFLSVDVAEEPGEEVLYDGGFLDIELGPPLDGELSVRQLIALTGLKVDELDGFQVSAEREAERDLSGATTFWSAIGISATNEGAEQFLSVLWREFPDCQLFENIWSQPRGRKKRPLWPGETPKEAILEIMLGAGCPKISLHYSRFKYDFPGYGSPEDNSRFSQEARREVETVGSIGCEVKYDSLRISSEFRTDDTLARTWLERLDQKLDACFPEIEYSPHDLATGEITAGEAIKTQDDPEITKWVQVASNRFRYIRRAARDLPLIGYR
ncbi:hypothetical protein [Psychromarinibacter halotolerans]|uniref:Uncharacterized protein n=1 Tax=Psychromarinibacter halotolerans TaxID=1775175 RepID=A0ABV7GKU9_9RHOB|nr:hypothetical protein [Psychromarinibacter halotolerans]MDF0597930.1 hypothetical protein [Psychromarinibacter halotolerans]